MKERPILFGAPMVRAILAGTKTQTRRIVKPQPGGGLPDRAPVKPYACPDGRWNWVIPETGMGTGDPFPCPYGQSGDRLWVRETWDAPPGVDNRAEAIYRADLTDAQIAEEREALREFARDAPGRRTWRPSIHMPRAFSRITLELTSVRVERLRDISEQDARAEGVEPDFGNAHTHAGNDHRRSFFRLWNEINGGDYAGTDERWAWVLAFRRLEE